METCHLPYISVMETCGQQSAGSGDPRTAESLAGLDKFRINGLELTVTTDDGSHGLHGLVADALQQSIAAGDVPDHVVRHGFWQLVPDMAVLTVAQSVAVNGITPRLR